MLESVEAGEIYVSKRSGIQFYVSGIARHGQDCEQTMVVYRNITATEDYPSYTEWVISESMFLNRFEELP